MRRPLVAGVLILVVAFALPLAGAQGGGEFDTLPIEAGGVSGQAFISELVGDELWVGGSFSTARDFAFGLPDHASQNLTVIDINTGQVRTDRSFSLVESGSRTVPMGHPDSVTDGAVFALETDGQTMWVGGWFATAQGQNRTNLAAYDTATGELVSSFAPNLNDPVESLLLHDGWLYVAGDFDNAAGTSLDHLVRMNPTTGVVDTGFDPQPADRVWKLDADNNRIYAAGEFGVEAYDAITGDASGPSFDGIDNGLDLAVSPDGNSLAVGDESNDVVVFDISNGNRRWTVDSEGDMLSVAWTDSHLYVGLSNYWDEPQDRRKLVALNPSNGSLDTSNFVPELNSFWAIRSILITEQGLVATGDFQKIATGDYDNEPGINARRVAIFRPTAAWDPAPPVVPPVVAGDVNCDDVGDVVDALVIAQYAVGSRTATESCPLADPANQLMLAAADVDQDDRIDIVDALLIAQCSVGISNLA